MHTLTIVARIPHRVRRSFPLHVQSDSDDGQPRCLQRGRSPKFPAQTAGLLPGVQPIFKVRVIFGGIDSRAESLVLSGKTVDSAAFFSYNARMVKPIFVLCVFAALSCARIHSDTVFAGRSEKAVSERGSRSDGFLSYVLGSGRYFSLNPVTDPVLIGSGTALFTADLFLSRFKSGHTFGGTPYSRDDVNAFDRPVMRPIPEDLI